MQNNIPLYVIIGTRAQLIKMGPLMLELEHRGIEYTFIYTEQHKVTIDDILEDFGVKTKYIKLLNSQDEARSISLFAGWAAKMIMLLLNPFSNKKVLPKGKGIIITHGDTATTSWSAVYGKSRFCKVMHIESGLRSYNLFEPFPEEIQRLITFLFSDFYVCPNDWALNNLKRFPGKKVNTKANTLYDSIIVALEKSKSPKIQKQIAKLNLPERFALVSLHRYENIFKEKRFNKIISILKTISEKINLVMIMHPVTEKKLRETKVFEELEQNPNIQLLKRQSFFDFVAINARSEFVITDGGSNQEEMSYIGKPAILFRDKTERTEGLGENIVLSKLNEKIIMDFVENYKDYEREPLKLKHSSSEKAIDFLESILEEKS